MEQLLAWFDNRTLLACQLLLGVILAAALLLMRRAHPHFRGIGYMAAAYIIGIPGLLLIVIRGNIPLLLSTAGGNALILLSYYFSYRGIQRFVGDRSRYLYLLEISGVLGVIDLIYFTSFSPNIVPRSMATAWFIAVARLLPAIALFRYASGRKFYHLAGAIYAIFAFFSLQRFIFTFVNGAPQDFMQRNSVQTLSLITGFAYIGITGLIQLAIITGELRAATERDAQHDSLTGALNRAAIEAKFTRELELAGRTGLPLSLLLMDIDYFKTINDTAGHAAGDEALRSVARCILNQLRAYDTLGRYGGDEFLLLLPATSGADAMLAAERIRAAVRNLPALPHNLHPTLSIGIAQSEPNDSVGSLLARSDAALYRVKRTGRDALHFQPYTDDPTPTINSSIAIE